MKTDLTAIFVIGFTVFVCIACVLCLAPVFVSFKTAWIFLCQYVSLTILANAFESIFRYVKEQINNNKSK